MQYLAGHKIRTILTNRGICHTIWHEDIVPEKVLFDVKIYVGKKNAYDGEVWLNGLRVHVWDSYLDLHETFVYADKVISDIIENHLGGKKA
jgi:hypothetical protein